MFSKKEIDAIDKAYFTIITVSAFAVTLCSNNTGHCWHIIYREGRGWHSCTIEHTHHKGDAYHQHGTAPTLAAALDKIKKHDWYQCNVRDRKKALKHRKTCF